MGGGLVAGGRGRGKGYQTMMNNVLRAFLQTRRQSEAQKSKPKQKSAVQAGEASKSAGGFSV